MSASDLTIILAATVSLSTPILLAALGGLISERSGIFAIGLEGYMLTGAFFAVLVAMHTNAYLGVLAGGLAGIILALLYAIVTISFRLHQITASIGLIILAIGLTSFLNDGMLERANSAFQRAPGLERIKIPVLSDIPIVGSALFNQNALVYFTAIAAIATVYFLNFSSEGRKITAVGLNPRVAESRGISVNTMRYVAVGASGLLAGLGGAMLSLGILNSFTPTITSGRGFIALAAIVFAGWRPLAVVAGSVIFGAMDAVQLWINSSGVLSVPPQLLGMLPYLLAILVFIVFASNRAPTALGVPYRREQRA